MDIKKHKVAPSLASIVKSIWEKLPCKPEYISIFYDWRSVVGSYYSSISAPHKVLTSGNKKTLFLKVKKGYTLEIQYAAPNILSLVHEFLGKVYFSDIKIIQSDQY
ncbi:MAG: DUF721 domain-containing protein [Holosporaceae bacterium]|jgi:hypothetical protein|nr:DUF721 domain-containing protein [Holosporaceae bacterium]